MSTENRTRPALGETRVSYHAEAYGLTGKPLDHGQAYADAWESQGGADNLREWAARLFNNDYLGWPVGWVTIYGREMEFYGPAWRDSGNRDHNFYEVLIRPTPVTYSAADLAKRCYVWHTTVMDYYEEVPMHERRIDGSCKCGEYPATYGRD